MLLEILLTAINYIYAITPYSIKEQGISKTFGNIGRILYNIFITTVLYRPSALFNKKSGNFSIRGENSYLA